jgi:hypothetical protein
MAAGGSRDFFTQEDIEQLHDRGLSVEEARRQVGLLARPPDYAEIDRPCTLGDGIEKVDAVRVRDLARYHEEASRAGRCLKFIPASGAASRMFKDLLSYRAQSGPFRRDKLEVDALAGSREAVAVREFIDGLKRFAFGEDLERAAGGPLDDLARRGEFGTILDGLLTEGGMGYAGLPKRLLKFHLYEDGDRTPFEEHLVEAAVLIKDEHGACRLHFTVSPRHRGRFEALLEKQGRRLEERHGVTFRVGFSVQKPSSDTLCLDLHDRPFRREDGALQFRPAGHGALIENLHDLRSDIILIKNIDNVVPDRMKEATYTWSRALIGRLIEIQNQARALLLRLVADPPDQTVMEKSVVFLRMVLNRQLPMAGAAAVGEEGRAAVLDLLDRPVRVCGMVPNTGEPGGGPFWVRARDGTASLQIVESAQVNPASTSQQRLFARSTHHNPVFMVCGVRNRRGEPYDLHRYIDHDAVIVTRKSAGGMEIKALERPGLWNGAMAGWNTVFVEVPVGVYNPVKTVNALLRAEHQPG